MPKPKPERVIPQLLTAVLKMYDGKNRASLYTEYIILHYRASGRIAPGCDARDFFAAFDLELERRETRDA